MKNYLDTSDIKKKFKEKKPNGKGEKNVHVEQNLFEVWTYRNLASLNAY